MAFKKILSSKTDFLLKIYKIFRLSMPVSFELSSLPP